MTPRRWTCWTRSVPAATSWATTIPYKRFKTENWRSPLVDRPVYADWEASGSKNYQQRVHERMVEILEAETEPLAGREDVQGAAPHLRAGRCAAQG